MISEISKKVSAIRNLHWQPIILITALALLLSFAFAAGYLVARQSPAPIIIEKCSENP